jgi:hypothetical protein
MATKTPNTLLSAELVAQWLGCTVGTVYHLARTKRLKSIRVDKVLFDPVDVLVFKARKKRQGRPCIGDKVDLQAVSERALQEALAR